MSDELKKNYVFGYFIGGSFFLIILPIIFYFGAQKIDLILNLTVIESPIARFIISIILFAAGLLFSSWSIVVQNRIGRGGPLQGYKVNVSPKTQKLNTVGPYKYTRNPMLFGTCSLYFSLALFLNSLAFLFFAFLFSVFMIIFVKNTEEKRLLEDFGQEYEAYRKRTSLFIPWPPKTIQRP